MRLTFTVLLGALLLGLAATGCQPSLTDVELKRWNYLGVGKADAILPKKARRGGIRIVDDTPTTEADLKPLEVKVVLKKDGKNYAFTDYGGYFWPSSSKDSPVCYAAYQKRFLNPSASQALRQAQHFILKFYGARLRSQKPITLQNKYEGREIAFTIPARGGVGERQAIVRLVFVSRGKGSKAIHRVWAIQAFGDEAFMQSENTKKVLGSLKIG